MECRNTTALLAGIGLWVILSACQGGFESRENDAGRDADHDEDLCGGRVCPDGQVCVGDQCLWPVDGDADADADADANDGGGDADADADSDDAADADRHVDADPREFVVTCPANQTVRIGDAVVLTAIITSGEEILDLDWELAASPEESRAAPSPDDAASTTITVDELGDYELRFTAIDDLDRTRFCETTVSAGPVENLYISLTWDTAGTDLDQHLLHPSADSWLGDDACYWSARNPEWDTPSDDDNPSLNDDNRDGSAPEIISIPAPVVGHEYRSGVHNASMRDISPTNATVHIYCSGVLAHAATRELDAVGSLDANDFWRVADIGWNADGTCTIGVLDTIITGGEARTTR